MKCRHFFFFVLVLFLSLFFGSFITISDTFAVDDFVLTIDSSSDISQSSNRIICGTGSNRICSDWSYVIYEFSGQSFDSSNNIEFRQGTFYTYFYPYFNPYLLQRLENLSSSPLQFNNFSSWLSTGTLTITLTDTFPSSSTPPFGNIDISSNGTYDVSSYATATVNVPVEVTQGDYHDDLISINRSIITCGAILLVLYFFYCIYRLIIKNSGVH